jgi:UTP--glucose-1-phosphate uridylyltransferase
METGASVSVRTAVIPAAGIGTRFLPASKAIPKEMVCVIDRPAIQWIVEEAFAAGVERVVIVTHADKPEVERHFRPSRELRARVGRNGSPELVAALDHLDELGERIQFVRQPEPRGLGHAVLCAAEKLGEERFLVLLGDALVRSPTPACAQLLTVAAHTGGRHVIGLERVPREKASRYGIAGGMELSPGVLRITELVEKPDPQHAPSDLAIAGRYLLGPEVLEALRCCPPGRSGEIQLTDAIRARIAADATIGLVYEGERHDIGNPRDYLDAVVAFALEDRWLRELVLGRMRKSGYVATPPGEAPRP